MNCLFDILKGERRIPLIGQKSIEYDHNRRKRSDVELVDIPKLFGIVQFYQIKSLRC